MIEGFACRLRPNSNPLKTVLVTVLPQRAFDELLIKVMSTCQPIVVGDSHVLQVLLAAKVRRFTVSREP